MHTTRMSYASDILRREKVIKTSQSGSILYIKQGFVNCLGEHTEYSEYAKSMLNTK